MGRGVAGWIRRPFAVLLVLFLVGLGARLSFVEVEHMHREVKLDARAYHQIAMHIVAGRGYHEGPPDQEPRPAIKRASPLMPTFLSGIYAVVGPNIRVVTWVQSLISAAIIFPLFFLVRGLTSRDGPALLAAFIGAFFPDFYYHAGLLLPELIAEFLLVLFVALVVLYEECGHRSTLLWSAAAAAGLLTLARPQFLPVGLVYALYLAVRTTGISFLSQVPWRDVLAFVLVFLLVMSPFALRNWVEYGEPIYGSTTLSCNLLIGNQLGGWGGGWPSEETKDVIRKNRDRPLQQREDCWRALGNLVEDHPLHVAKMLGVKLISSLSVTRTAAEYWFIAHPVEVVLVQVTHPFLLACLFVLGLSYLGRTVRNFGSLKETERTFVLLLAALGLSMLAIFTGMWLHLRYRAMIYVLLIPASLLELRVLLRTEPLSRLWTLTRLRVALFVVLGSTAYEVWYHYWLYAREWWNFG